MKEEDFRIHFNSRNPISDGEESAKSFQELQGKNGENGSEDHDPEARSRHEVIEEEAEPVKSDPPSEQEKCTKDDQIRRVTRSMAKNEGTKLNAGL